MNDNDLISRAAAIEALSTPCDKRYRHGVWETCLDNIETAIRNIPSVDAIPIDWLREKMRGYASALKSTELSAVVRVMCMWEREQEART